MGLTLIVWITMYLPVPQNLCGKGGSCLPMVGSLQYSTLTNCMQWFPLPIKLTIVKWPVQFWKRHKPQINKCTWPRSQAVSNSSTDQAQGCLTSTWYIPWLSFFDIKRIRGCCTLLPPYSENGVRFPAQPQVGKLVVACCWSAVYSTEPWPTVCTGCLCP